MSQIYSDIIYNCNLQSINETNHHFYITIPIVQDIENTDTELIEIQNINEELNVSNDEKNWKNQVNSYNENEIESITNEHEVF